MLSRFARADATHFAPIRSSCRAVESSWRIAPYPPLPPSDSRWVARSLKFVLRKFPRHPSSTTSSGTGDFEMKNQRHSSDKRPPAPRIARRAVFGLLGALSLLASACSDGAETTGRRIVLD